MSSNSQRFATAVLAAFEAAGHFTDDEIKAAKGPSSSTMTKLRAAAERGEPLASPRSDTLKRIDTAAGWRRGTARALWRYGIEPREASAADEKLVVEEIPGDFREWLASTDLLSEHQRRQVFRMLDRLAAERVSDPSDNIPDAIAADEQERSIAGEQEEGETP